MKIFVQYQNEMEIYVIVEIKFVISTRNNLIQRLVIA